MMEVTVHDVAAKRAAGDKFVLVDCREHTELAICQIEGAVHVPMRETPNRLDELPEDKDVIVFCHGGVRSLQVAQFLRQNGYDRAWSMAGGIDRWSVEIDPSVPRY